MLQVAGDNVSGGGAPAFTRFLKIKRSNPTEPQPPTLEAEKTEKVFGIDVPLSVARSEREMTELKERMIRVARIMSKSYDVEVIPSPSGGWSVEIHPDAARFGKEFVAGLRSTLRDLPEETFKPKRIFYDIKSLLGASEEEVLLRLRHQVGRIQYCDIRHYFEGQKIAKDQGALPSSWLSLQNALDECWVDTRESIDSEDTRGKIVALNKDRITETRLRINNEPLTRQFTESLRYYWANNKIMPDIKNQEVRAALDKARPEIEKYFYSKTHADAFKILTKTIWPIFKALENSAKREETLREVAREVSGVPVGAISESQGLLSLWDNDAVINFKAALEEKRSQISFPQDTTPESRPKLAVLADEKKAKAPSAKEETAEKSKDDKESKKKTGLLKRAWKRIRRIFGAKQEDESSSVEAEFGLAKTAQNAKSSLAVLKGGNVGQQSPSAPAPAVATPVSPAALSTENVNESANNSDPSLTPQPDPVQPVVATTPPVQPNPATQAPTPTVEVKPQFAQSTGVRPITQEQPALSADAAQANLAEVNASIKSAEKPTSPTPVTSTATSSTVVSGVDVNAPSPQSASAPTPLTESAENKLIDELSDQLSTAIQSIEIDKIRPTPTVPDIDLGRLSPSSTQALEKHLEQSQVKRRAQIQAEAERKLELKQARGLLFDMPAHFQVGTGTSRSGTEVALSFSRRPDDYAITTVRGNIERFITDYENREEVRRVEKIRVEEAQLNEVLKRERERRDMERAGFNPNETGLYQEFLKLENAMRPKVHNFMKLVAPLLPKGESYVFDGAHYTGRKFNKKAIAHYAPAGDMKLYSRRKIVEGEDPKMAVQLLIDNSGSMVDPPLKMQEALKTAIFFGRVLKDMGIPFSIKLFGEGVEQIMSLEDDYDRKDSRIKHRLITKANGEGGGTNMHMPLEQAYTELSVLKRRDPSIFGSIFIISDSGANRGLKGQALQTFIDNMRRDFTVTNFILSQNPSEIAEAKSYFGAQHVVAPRNFEELPNEAFRVLRATMERALRAQGGIRKS